jgi:hypothetical protein
LTKATKELQVVVSPPVSLVDVQPGATQDVQVLYKGTPVTKVFLLQLLIKNSGNQPIASGDYNRQLSFTFPTEYKLADVTVTSSTPPNLGMNVSKVSDHEALATSTLLNPEDSVVVRFVLIGDSGDGLASKISIDGRILGIPEIQVQSSVQQNQLNLIPIAVATVAGAIVAVLANLFTDRILAYVRRKPRLTGLPQSVNIADIGIADDFVRRYPDSLLGHNTFNGITFDISRRYFDTSATQSRTVQLTLP